MALRISDFMFWGDNRVDILKTLTDDEILTFQNAMWGFEYNDENLFETIVTSWLEKSNSNSRNAVKSGAIYINEEKVEDFNLDVNSKFINDKVMLVRKWKKNFRILTK